MSRVYICGPMTPTRFDEPDPAAHEYLPFHDAEEKLTAAGHVAYNPATNSKGGQWDESYLPLSPETWAELKPDEYTTAYREVMERDIRWLLECDGVALLPGWRRSQGAMFEHSIAAFLHKEITNVAGWAANPPKLDTIESAVRPRMSVAGNRIPEDSVQTGEIREGEVVFSEDALLADGPIGPRHYDGDAGLDLWVAEEFVHLAKGEFKDVSCNLRIELPKDTWALIQGRSSTFRKRGIHVVQGVIDNGYRGPIAVGCWNTTDKDVYIVRGESLAQLIVLPLIRPPVMHCGVSTESADGRGAKGFGSTGGINSAKAAEVLARG